MGSELNFSYDTGQEIRLLLQPGESLLWSGQPRKGVVFRKSDIIVIPFSLVWFGFACGWEYIALTMVKNWFFIAFGAMFVFAGFNFAIGRFFIDARQRARTTYGVTNRRIIIKRPFNKNSITEIDINSISDLAYDENNDSSGTIKFGQDNLVPNYNAFKTGSLSKYKNLVPMFEMIPQVRNVYDIINRQRDKKNDSGF